MKTHRFLQVSLVFLCLLATSPPNAQAQRFKTKLDRYFQGGFGFLPGLGLQGGLVIPYDIVTLEAMGQLNFTLPIRDKTAAFHLMPAVGGSLRIFSLINQVGEPINPNVDVDLGFRLGAQVQIPAQFKLKVEPFARGVLRLRTGNQAYLEAGATEPYLRVGLWVPLQLR